MQTINEQRVVLWRKDKINFIQQKKLIQMIGSIWENVLIKQSKINKKLLQNMNKGNNNNNLLQFVKNSNKFKSILNTVLSNLTIFNKSLNKQCKIKKFLPDPQ